MKFVRFSEQIIILNAIVEICRRAQLLLEFLRLTMTLRILDQETIPLSLIRYSLLKALKIY